MGARHARSLSPGRAGQTLPAIHRRDDGDETYGAGRYLDPEIVASDTLQIDFNRAYNPYCAYDARWVCPVSPPENHLDLPVRVGEEGFRPWDLSAGRATISSRWASACSWTCGCARSDVGCRRSRSMTCDAERSLRGRGSGGDLAEAALAAARHLERVQRAARRHPQRARAAWMELPLGELRACVVDLETTGTHAGAEILEIGAVQVADDRLEAEFSTLVRPWGEIAPAAFTVHGIGMHAVLDAPRIEAVLPSWLEHAAGCVLVFHNAGFDLGFLQRALRDTDRPLLTVPLVDTLTLASRLLGGRCGLGEAARRRDSGPHLHRALPRAR